MDKGEYEAVSHQIGLFCQVVEEMPLKAFLLEIDRAEAVAPLFNPSLFLVFSTDQQAQRNLEMLKFAAGKMLEIQNEFKKFKSESERGDDA